MRNLVLIGAGSMARVIHAYLEEAKENQVDWQIKGFLDDNPAALKDYPRISLPILDNTRDYMPEPNDLLVMAIADTYVRERLYHAFKDKGAQFLTYTHPLAYITASAEIGEGCIVGPYANITVDSKLGRCVFCHAYTSIGHDAQIGDFSILYSHCSINGFSQLGKGVLLGSHSVIVPDVTLGDYARVVAGSTVLNRKVKPKAVVVGVPAKEILVG